MQKICCVLPFIFLPSLFAQPATMPDMELVESVPIETVLGSSDIRNPHDVWIEMIGKAQSTIDLEEYYIANQPGEPLQDVLSALCAAADRGVHIRILADAKMYKTYPVSVDTLGKHHNIETRTIDFGKIAGGIQHAKYFIVDDLDTYIGSQNFDWRSLKHIHELGFRIHNKQLASMDENIFAFDWNLAVANSEKKISHPVFSLSYLLPIRCSVQNGDTAAIVPTFSPKYFIPDTTLWDEPQIVRLIDQAQHTVLLQFLTYSPLERHGERYAVIDNAIRRAAARGVQVKMIVADWEKSSAALKALKELSALPNIEVAFTAIPEWSGGYISFARVEHCKYIVADSTAFWLGTANCEKNYFYNTRNLGIVGTNTLIANRLVAIFLKSWNSPYKEIVTQNGTYFPRDHGEK